MRRLATANAIFSALIMAFADSIGNDNTDNPSDHPFPLYSLSSLSFLFVYDKIDSFFSAVPVAIVVSVVVINIRSLMLQFRWLVYSLRKESYTLIIYTPSVGAPKTAQ